MAYGDQLEEALFGGMKHLPERRGESLQIIDTKLARIRFVSMREYLSTMDGLGGTVRAGGGGSLAGG